ncbi:MAG: right-handed parallel beta-helix repeat-containing protein [Verrucomicrobiota bacterium]
MKLVSRSVDNNLLLLSSLGLGGSIGLFLSGTASANDYHGIEASVTETLAEPSSLVVTTDRDEEISSDGLTSLREAISYAATLGGAQEITFSDGSGGTVDFTDDIPETIILNGTELSIESDVKITGPGASKLTVSGNDASRIFSVAAGTTSEISGITVSGGFEINGAGIRSAGNLTILGSIITGNRGSNGGGIQSISSGKLTVRRTSIYGNSGFLAGGGIDSEGEVTILDSTISGNSSTGTGGGMVIRGTAHISNTTISENESSRGGGIFSVGTTTLTNATVSGNTAPDGWGGGIFTVSGSVSIANTIVANSTGGDFARREFSGISNATSSLIEGGFRDISGRNVDNLTGDPLLGPLQDNGGPTLTHTLLVGSPAIDAGDNELVVDGDREPLLTDQRGEERIAAGIQGASEATVDLGAFELFVAPSFTSQPSPIEIDAGELDLVSLLGPQPPRGVFSGPGVVGGQFDPTSAGRGDHVVLYTTTDSFGVSNEARVILSVFRILLRPDLRSGRLSKTRSHRGNDKYGGGQSYRATSRDRSVSFFFSVENDAIAIDQIRIALLSRARRDFDLRIRSRNGLGNVTASLLGPGYLATIPPGRIRNFQAEVGQNRAGDRRVVFRTELLAFSELDPSAFDQNKIRIVFERDSNGSEVRPTDLGNTEER